MRKEVLRKGWEFWKEWCERWENRYWEWDGNFGKNGVGDGKVGPEKGMEILKIMVYFGNNGWKNS